MLLALIECLTLLAKLLLSPQEIYFGMDNTSALFSVHHVIS